MEKRVNNHQSEKSTSNDLSILSKRLDAGLLGKWFGGPKNSPPNIAGFVAILLITAGIVTLFLDTDITSEKFWEIIVPILSMILGYLFGKKA